MQQGQAPSSARGKRVLRHPWPMLLAIALALVIGWLVFTVLRPVPTTSSHGRLAETSEPRRR